jgi:hypothetical protein
MTVKIEGKNVHLLGDSMLNNLGPSGSPPNTGATMMGADHTDLSIESRCKKAREEAQRLADEHQVRPGPTDEKPATASCCQIRQQAEFGRQGFSVALVKDLAQQWPSPNDHLCAELTAISKNISLHGLASVSSVITQSMCEKGLPDHGQRAACEGCNPLLQALGSSNAIEATGRLEMDVWRDLTTRDASLWILVSASLCEAKKIQHQSIDELIEHLLSMLASTLADWERRGARLKLNGGWILFRYL